LAGFKLVRFAHPAYSGRILEYWNAGIMGDLVLLHFVQDKFTMLKEGKWKIGLSAKFPLKGKIVKLLYE